jgi:beta-glucosidase
MIATFSHPLTSLCLLIPVGLALMPGAAAQDKSAIDRRVETMLGKMTLEQKIDLIGGENEMFIRAVPSIGLPRLKMSDGPMGVRTWGPTTGYAAGVGLAASWDTDLAKRVGTGLGQDARARGVSFLLGPGVNIYRAPMNGRNFEYMGEDPYLAGRIASAYIQGVQSQGVIATVKHYAANNSEFDRHNSNSIVDERALREIYFPAFEAAVKEGHVGAVMDSYNFLNGEHATQNSFLNNQVLKKEWGFPGILMSDWGSTYDGVAAANGGLDLEMPNGQFMNRETLLPAVREGKVSQAVIDDKVRRILRTVIEFGLVDRDQTELGVSVYNQYGRAVALESAQKGAVLLKNEGNLLPLNPHKLHTIAVIGPDAWPAVITAGGSAEVEAFNPVSVLTGLSDALADSHVTVTYNRGLKKMEDVFGDGSSFFMDAEGKQPGLKKEEFASGDFSATPDRASIVSEVNGFGPWHWGPPPTVKGTRWTGYYIPKKSGKQRFILAGMGRDGYKLYLNNSLVLEESSPEGQVPHAYDADFRAGQPVPVRLEYNPGIEGMTLGFGAAPVGDLLDPQAAKLAAKADVVVLCAGYSPETESEGQDRNWQLPTGQDELIDAVLAANPKTIVLVTSGGGVDTNQWLDRTPAFLQTWYPGQEGGRAVADILLGHVNPGGKLPISYERHIEDNPTFNNYYPTPGTKDIHYNEGIFVGYRHYDKSETKPLFPFGFGLSYTTFAFSNLSVSATEPFAVSFDVKNTGSRAGAEVAQVYVGDPSATVPRPVKELKGFSRVELKPGETRHVSVTLDHRSLAYWDVVGKGWKVDPGKFTVYVGDSSANVPLKADITVR